MELDEDSGAATVHSAAIRLPVGDADIGGDFELIRNHGAKTVALVGDVEGNGRDAAPYADRLCAEAELDTGLPLDGATPGLPLGVDASCGAKSAERRPLRPGEGILLFTDGLEDVKGSGGDRFGSARITHALARRLRGADPDEIVNVLHEVACDFGESNLPDDLCVLALRVT